MADFREPALKLIIAGGLVGIGCAAGAPVAAFASIIGGVGGNWLHEFSRAGVARWSDNWLTPAGALNAHLQRAYQRALQDTFASFAASYQQMPEYKLLYGENKERARLIRDELQGFAAQVESLFADPHALGDLIDRQAAPKLQQALATGGRPDLTLARDALREGANQWLASYEDEGVLSYIRKYISVERVEELTVRFFDELKKDNAEGTAAWRAWQLLEQQSYAAALADLDVRIERTEAAVLWLRDWAERLQTLPVAQVDPAGRAQLPGSVADLRVMEERLAARIDGIPEAVRPVLQQELQAVLHPAAQSPPTPPPAPRLFGRDTFLAELAQTIVAANHDGDRPLALTAPQALHGLPGVGKTALAKALANHPLLAAAFPDGRAWIELGPQPDMMTVLGGALLMFGVEPGGLDTAEARAIRLRAELAGKRVLLAVDDVWAAEHARPFQQACPASGFMLLTTRQEQIAADLHAEAENVHKLKPNYARAMLADAGPQAKRAMTADSGATERLLAFLDGLPLALHVAGRQLQRMARTDGVQGAVADLNRQLHDRQRRILELRAAEKRPGLDEAEPSLEAAIALSYDALPDEATRCAFRRLAVLGAQPLDYDTAAMAAVWEADEKEAAEIRMALVEAGLLEVEFRHSDERSEEESSGASDGDSLRLRDDNRRSEQVSPAVQNDTPARFSLHQILQAFAQAYLEKDPAEARNAALVHARHYAVIVFKANAMMTTPELLKGLAWFDAEIGQIRQAVEWSLMGQDTDATEVIRDLIVQLRNYALLRELHREYWEWLEAAETACNALEDTNGQANVLKAKGDVLAFQKRNDEALQHYDDASALFKQVGDRLGQANVLKAKGDVLAFQKRNDEALQHYDDASALFKQVGSSLGQANVLKAKGHVLAFLDRRDEALQHYDDASALFKQVGSSLGQANVLKAKGHVLAFLDRRDEALQHYDDASALFKQVGDRLGQANVLKAKGDVLAFQKRNDEALQHYDDASALFKQVGDRLGQANVLQAKGDVLAFQKRNDEALQHYDDASALFKQVGDRLGQANVLQAKGDVLAFQKRNDEALQHYDDASALFKQVGSSLGQANVLQAKGDVLAFQKRNDEALQHYDDASALFKQVGSSLGQANVLQAKGDVLAFQKRNDEALQHYDDASALFKQVGDRLGQANVLQAKGDVLAFLDRRDEALQHYDDASALFKQVGSSLGQANVLRATGDILAFQSIPSSLISEQYYEIVLFSEINSYIGLTPLVSGFESIAEDKYHQAFQLYKQIGGVFGLGLVHFSLGRFFLQNGRFQAGMKHIDEAGILFDHIQTDEGAACVQIVRAYAAAINSDFINAANYMQPAADFGKAVGHPLGDQLQSQIDAWRAQADAAS